MSDKKSKFLTKQVSFGGREITMYSIDGFTWSTRRAELNLIKERQEREKVTFSAVKDENGETKVEPKGGSENEMYEDSLNERFDVAEYKEISGDTKPVVEDFLQDIPMLRMALRPKEKKAKNTKESKAAEKAAKKAKEAKPIPAKKGKEKSKVVKLPAAKQKSGAAKKPAAKVAPKKRVTSKPAKPTKAKSKAGKKRAA